MARIDELPDSPPVTDDLDDSEFRCSECNRALTYSGRGRKPSRCSPNNDGDPDCYGKRGGNSSASGRKDATDRLANQAAKVLATVNAAVGTAGLFVGFHATAGAIAESNDEFEANAREALRLDPALSRMILRGGQNGGKLALIVAYVMFGASVIPAIQTDMAKKRAARQEAQLDMELEAAAA